MGDEYYINKRERMIAVTIEAIDCGAGVDEKSI